MAEGITAAELFAELGFKVDQSSLGAADKGISALTALAERAIAVVEGLTAAFAGLGTTAAEAGSAVRAAGGGLSGSVADARRQWFERAGIPDPSAPVAEAVEPHAPAGGHGAEHGASAHAPAGGHGGGHGIRHAHPEGLEGVIERANHVTHGFLALFAGHEVLHFAHEMEEAGVQVELTSRKLGISTDAVQQLQYAASLKSIDKGQLGIGLRFLQVNAQKAADGGKEAAAAFQALGISVKDTSGHVKPADDLFEEVATKIAAVKDPAKQTSLAVQIFGRSGQELVPLLKEGGEGIRQFREEAEALGGGLNETLIENAEEYEHNTKRLGFAFLGVKSAIGNLLLPMLTHAAQALTTLALRFNEVYKHTSFFQTLLAVGLVASLMKVVLWLSNVGTAAILTWVKTVGTFILIAAAIAGVSLVLEDLYKSMTGGRSAIGKWIDSWQGIGSTSELVKNIAGGIDSITQAIKNFTNSPWETFKSFLGDVGYFMGAKDVLAQDELANRAVATGRGLDADARSNIDIPRAAGRGLNAHADAAFGQAKASIFNPASANSDSVQVNVHVKTDASAKEIGHHVKKAIEEHHEKVNKRVHHALVPQADAGEE